MAGFQHHSTPFDCSQYAYRMNTVQEYLDRVKNELPGLQFPSFNPEEHKLPDLTPPRIVVLGNKDAGKTSLIYTLAQIPLTREIKTYCPLEIQLRRATTEVEWNCVVSVLQLKNQKWEIIPSAKTKEKDEVQDKVYEAQESVTDGWGNFKTFSSIIRIQITGAALDLDLMDLPCLDRVRP